MSKHSLLTLFKCHVLFKIIVRKKVNVKLTGPSWVSFLIWTSPYIGVVVTNVRGQNGPKILLHIIWMELRQRKTTALRNPFLNWIMYYIAGNLELFFFCCKIIKTYCQVKNEKKGKSGSWFSFQFFEIILYLFLRNFPGGNPIKQF